jgi:decaprenylphospho-beta-D-ribofuranose 2-oxidase
VIERQDISGWGRWPRQHCTVITPPTPEAVGPALHGLPSVIARGLGRSYGDSALNRAGVVATTRLDRMIAFDPETGTLEAEAGVSLAEVIAAFLPRGFFPFVTPGTRFVTLGGAIAADVHGKNHHRDGAFGDHVAWFDLLCPDGKTRRCSATRNRALFTATLGGMGLTGIVLRAAIRLRRVESAWIRQRRIVAPDLDSAIAAFEANLDATYSVAWIDCLAAGAARGRSLLYLGEHAGLADLDSDRRRDPFAVPRRKTRSMPLNAPSFSLNRLTVGLFNRAYFRAGEKAPEAQIVDWDTYFYPLDALRDWNRIYGAKGFAQYQCALPLATARDGLAALLDAIGASGRGSFLAVLKRFGAGAADRPLSFPMEGYTLALDFPMSPAALSLMDRLDTITRAAGGRLYLAKDSRMTSDTLRAGYGAALDHFQKLRDGQTGPFRFASSQSQRLGL